VNLFLQKAPSNYTFQVIRCLRVSQEIAKYVFCNINIDLGIAILQNGTTSQATKQAEDQTLWTR